MTTGVAEGERLGDVLTEVVALGDADTRTLCLLYAGLERRLGEADRGKMAPTPLQL